MLIITEDERIPSMHKTVLFATNRLLHSIRCCTSAEPIAHFRMLLCIRAFGGRLVCGVPFLGQNWKKKRKLLAAKYNKNLPPPAQKIYKKLRNSSSLFFLVASSAILVEFSLTFTELLACPCWHQPKVLKAHNRRSFLGHFVSWVTVQGEYAASCQRSCKVAVRNRWYWRTCPHCKKDTDVRKQRKFQKNRNK